MLMNALELGFANNDEIRTDDFNFEDNDLHLDSPEHQEQLECAGYHDDDSYIDRIEAEYDHAVEAAGGSDNFWRNWHAEQEAAETAQHLS